MKNELKVLKQQKSNLMDGLGKRSPSPKTGAFIKENDKLQVRPFSNNTTNDDGSFDQLNNRRVLCDNFSRCTQMTPSSSI